MRYALAAFGLLLLGAFLSAAFEVGPRNECIRAGGVFAKSSPANFECWSTDGTRRLFPSDAFAW